jgi:hypothetical protein
MIASEAVRRWVPPAAGLPEIYSDRVRRSAVGRRGEGRCITNQLERLLIELHIATRLANTHIA